jgi:hypothetical protein
MSVKSLGFHPLAEVLPLIEGTEFNDLVNSIRAHGLREPITMLDDMILDGRNRYLACLKVGIEPRVELFTGNDPVAFVADKNLCRRHLTVGQRAMAVAKLATLSNGNPHRNLTAGIPAVKSTPEIAAMACINKESVSDAKTIQANGTPEEIASVVNGTAAISTVAKIVRARRDDEKADGKKVPDVRQGCRIVVPNGTTLSEMTRRGVKLQERGLSVDEVVKKVGLSYNTYVVIRDVVLLSEYDGLDKKDAEIVVQALRDIDEFHQVQRAREMIEPIARRVWGTRGQRLRSDKRRSEQFDNAITFLASTCENAEDIVIPYINQAKAEAAVQQLSAAEGSLRKLKKRILEVEHE